MDMTDTETTQHPVVASMTTAQVTDTGKNRAVFSSAARLYTSLLADVIERDDQRHGPVFTVHASLRRGVETVRDRAWEDSVQLQMLLEDARIHGRSEESDMEIHRMFLRLSMLGSYDFAARHTERTHVEGNTQAEIAAIRKVLP